GERLRREEDPREEGHRRGRAAGPRSLRGRGGLRVLFRQPALVHHHPHDRLPRNTRVDPGWRRNRRGLRSQDRMARDVLESAGPDPGPAHGPGGIPPLILVLDNYDSYTHNPV